MKDFIDISVNVNSKTPVFPGDTPFTRNVLLEHSRGDHLTLSTIKSTLHIGTHADAHSHANQDGSSIDKMPLTHYVGKCLVVDTVNVKNKIITKENIVDLESHAHSIPNRILIKTNSNLNSECFNNDFFAIDSSLIEYFSQKKVITIGTDTPSVDPSDSKELPAHKLCFLKNIAIIEGLKLNHVPMGYYELIALPLLLNNCDGSPVRAILRYL